MSKHMDKMIERLNNFHSADRLSGMEADVLQGINARRQEFRVMSAVAPFGLASIGLAMAIGLFVGTLTAMGAVDRPSHTPFSAGASLAPSSLLEGDR